MKTLQCRAHGGTFKIGPKRGRDPVNCGGNWPDCTRVKTIEIQGRKLQVEKSSPVDVLQPWSRAKAMLEALEWVCKGRGYKDHYNGRDNAQLVELTAVRGVEVISMLWVNGELISQDYTLWASEKTSLNGKPADSLTFNPDECTDRELVRALAGMKCTWWNVLGQKTEEAYIAAESIKIEHAYNGKGDESPGDRIVKFIEQGGAGFRAFRVAALLKVG